MRCGAKSLVAWPVFEERPQALPWVGPHLQEKCFSRGTPVTRQHGAGPWRDGVTTRLRRSWSSCASGSHESWRGDGDWVEMYAWASSCPNRDISALGASFEYSASSAVRAKFPKARRAATPDASDSHSVLFARRWFAAAAVSHRIGGWRMQCGISRFVRSQSLCAGAAGSSQALVQLSILLTKPLTRGF